MQRLIQATAISAGVLLAAMPASSGYRLNNYGFGSGGFSNGSSTNYRASGTTGEVGSVSADSTNYSIKSGNNNAQQANVPHAPTFTNPADNYDRLKFVINNGENPSDARFAIAISSDNFATTQYIQSDNTVGATLGAEDFQTYAAWGGASGQYVVGLLAHTTYTIKVKATTGDQTESAYSATATAATVDPYLTYDIDVAATDISTDPPYQIDLGNLLPDTIVDAVDKIWVGIDTNANAGGAVYIAGLNNGLSSAGTGATIASVTADLSSASTGYGAQVSGVAQSGGGPLTASAPFNGSGQNVGILSSTLQQVFASALPITAGRGSIQLKAKAASSQAAGGDYSDTLTVIGAGNF